MSQPERGYHVTEIFRQSGSWLWRCRTCNTFDGAYRGHRDAIKAMLAHEANAAKREAS